MKRSRIHVTGHGGEEGAMARIKLMHHRDGMLAHLDAPGIPHVRTSAASVAANRGGIGPPHPGRTTSA